MVLINGRKFACQSCIKGHRSSNCNHPDRPLFEIRKKGRPVTQCDTCRELRTTKKLHVKCACDGRRDPESEVGPVEIQSPRVAATKRRPGRKIPLVPTLPNGVKDVEMVSSPVTVSSETPSDQSQGTDEDSTISLVTRPNLVDPVTLSSPPACAEQKRSCCSGKKLTQVPSFSAVPQRESGAPQSLLGRTIQQPISISSLPNAPIAGPPIISPMHSRAPENISDPSNEMMECLCGPACVCLGCTKHGNYASGEADRQPSQGMDCPADCPSCIDNEHGAAWPTSSFHPSSNQWTSGGAFSFYPSVPTTVFAPQASTSTSSAPRLLADDTLAVLNFSKSLDWLLDPDAEGDYDIDLDAEGSPNPEYIDLPSFATHMDTTDSTKPTKTPPAASDSETQQKHQMKCCTDRTCC
ncbi:hypothetical protein FRC15_006763 [Serendipita sp. 397]|nr:hypothetical protein FRC15_006763 [Serendipita sp. 397]